MQGAMAQAIRWPPSFRALQQQALMSGEVPARLQPPLMRQACKACSQLPAWQSHRQKHPKRPAELEDLKIVPKAPCGAPGACTSQRQTALTGLASHSRP